MSLLSRPLELPCPRHTGCSREGAGSWGARSTAAWSFPPPGEAIQAGVGLRRGHRHSFHQRGSWSRVLERRSVTKCFGLVLFSSSCEFGAAFESAEDEEGEEELSASQAAVHTAATEEAVRRYIRSRPALYRKVLLYQPFELAELQAGLKQHGIRVATAKLLDFLDAHCITFTTAAARKEKLHQKRRQPVGKKRGRATRPVRPSPPLAISSL